jgi:hypothetical protein
MSSYVQRLFDRAGATAASAPPLALRPALPSQSPIAEHDQRLHDPDLSAALLGMPPLLTEDAASFDDDMPGATVARPAASAAVPRPRIARPEPPRIVTQLPPPGMAPRTMPSRAAEPHPRADTGTSPRQAAEPRPGATVSPVAPRPIVVAPSIPHPTPLKPQQRQPAEPTPPAPPSPRAATAPRPILIPPPAAPAPIPSPPEPVARPMVEAAASLTPREAPPVVSVRSTAAAPKLLEPLPLPPPEPLPPSEPARATQTEARVRPEPTQAAPVAQPVPAGRAEAAVARKTPATAEEASLIGRLTPRRRTHLIFGLRRR